MKTKNNGKIICTRDHFNHINMIEIKHLINIEILKIRNHHTKRERPSIDNKICNTQLSKCSPRNLTSLSTSNHSITKSKFCQTMTNSTEDNNIIMMTCINTRTASKMYITCLTSAASKQVRVASYWPKNLT